MYIHIRITLLIIYNSQDREAIQCNLMCIDVLP